MQHGKGAKSITLYLCTEKFLPALNVATCIATSVCSLQLTTYFDVLVKCVKTEKLTVNRNQTQGSYILQLQLPVLHHWSVTTRQPPAITVFYMYCTSGFQMKQGMLKHLASPYSCNAIASCSIRSMSVKLGISPVSCRHWHPIMHL